MKIYFVRHGEGFDDIYNEYGGWSDRELSPNGVQLVFTLAEKLKKIAKGSEIIMTSPLKRSSQTAQIVGNGMKLRVVDEPYLKERNTYGLLSGVNKDIAVDEYPEMVDAFRKDRYIPAAERYKDFVERIGILLDRLENSGHENIIAVTHGHVITVIVEEFLGLIRNNIGNGCILGVEVDKKMNRKVIFTDKITFTTDPILIKARQLRKFKRD